METQTSFRYKEFVKWMNKNKANELPFTGNQAELADELIDFIDSSQKVKELIIGIGDRQKIFWLIQEWFKYQNRQIF